VEYKSLFLYITFTAAAAAAAVYIYLCKQYNFLVFYYFVIEIRDDNIHTQLNTRTVCAAKVYRHLFYFFVKYIKLVNPFRFLN